MQRRESGIPNISCYGFRGIRRVKSELEVRTRWHIPMMAPTYPANMEAIPYELRWTSDGCVLRSRWPRGHRRYVDTLSFWYVHWSVCTSSVRFPPQPACTSSVRFPRQPNNYFLFYPPNGHCTCLAHYLNSLTSLFIFSSITLTNIGNRQLEFLQSPWPQGIAPLLVVVTTEMVLSEKVSVVGCIVMTPLTSKQHRNNTFLTWFR